MAVNREELVVVAAQVLTTLISARSTAQLKSPMYLYGTKGHQGKEPRHELVELSLVFAQELLEAVDDHLSET